MSLLQVFFSKPTTQPEATLTSIQKQYTQDPYRLARDQLQTEIYFQFHFIFGLDFYVKVASPVVITITIIRIIIAVAGSEACHYFWPIWYL